MIRLAEKYGPWARWFEDGMEELVCKPWMTMTIMRVLACLVKGAKMSGQCTRTQRMIEDATGIQQPNIARAMRKLKKEGILYQIRRGGPYFFTLPWFYRGAESQYEYWKHQEVHRKREGERYAQDTASRRNGAQHRMAGTGAIDMRSLPARRGQ